LEACSRDAAGLVGGTPVRDTRCAGLMTARRLVVEEKRATSVYAVERCCARLLEHLNQMIRREWQRTHPGTAQWKNQYGRGMRRVR
jgi:hypothetical protein